MKKNFKKFASLMLALVMSFALAAPAFAADYVMEPVAADSVTVYVTKDMFTTGGIEEDGTTIPQKYVGAASIGKDHILAPFNIAGYELEISAIEEAIAEGGVQSVYNAPTVLPANVLDAIIVALQDHGVDGITGGWDAKPVSGPAGGYINSVPGAATEYYPTKTENVDGTNYTVYSGTGWNIAVGTSVENAKAIDVYGSSVGLTNGMVIIFDLSEYNIYYPAG